MFSWLFEGGVGLEQNVFKAMDKLAEVLVPAAFRSVAPEGDNSEAPLEQAQASSNQFKLTVVTWGLALSEFWRMTPTEWVWLYEAKDREGE